MVAKILNGRELANKILLELTTTIKEETLSGKRPPGLAVILVGNNSASEIYVNNKRMACKEVGIHSVYHHLPESISEVKLIELIKTLNHDSKIDGILLQLPLSSHIDTGKVIEVINPAKDVDGFHPYNLGRLIEQRPTFRPCTPFGIMLLLNSINQVYKNQHAVMIGASNIVGRPMAFELLMAGATITICHRLTKDIESHVRQADILVSAVGKPCIIKGDWIKPNATVIDVGINRLKNGKLIGDVEFDEASKKAAWITPVPGGVGPMTVAALLKNTLLAANNIRHITN